MTIAERFWPKVDKGGGPDACWIWTAWRNDRGYGQIRMRSQDGTWRMPLATHVSLKLAGIHLPPGMFALHRCDNPPCVNPAHLFVGTKRDNSRDMVAKGRSATGERHGRSKLTEHDVIDIRSLAAFGARFSTLGMAFDVADTTIRRIVRREIWGQVA